MVNCVAALRMSTEGNQIAVASPARSRLRIQGGVCVLGRQFVLGSPSREGYQRSYPAIVDARLKEAVVAWYYQYRVFKDVQVIRLARM